jgi:hypothetical protein
VNGVVYDMMYDMVCDEWAVCIDLGRHKKGGAALHTCMSEKRLDSGLGHTCRNENGGERQKGGEDSKTKRWMCQKCPLSFCPRCCLHSVCIPYHVNPNLCLVHHKL